MSGPIVRSGPSPEFSRNWENVFGKKSGSTPAAKKPAKKTAAVKSAKKAAGKKSKKSGK
ncbi:MAG TPA: hypothetical protein VG826_21785 [Pirellulales bacterium]|nr:hypothetical protein [Pirellulales bacterium]